MNSILGNAVLFTVLLASAGCSSVQRYNAHGNDGETPRARLEVIKTPQIEMREEIMKAPTEFTTPVSDARYAWERAQLFFKNHTSGSKFTASKGDLISLSNVSGSDKIIYTISRQPVKSGVKFQVKCNRRAERISEDSAILECKNLARFVRDGILESLL